MKFLIVQDVSGLISVANTRELSALLQVEGRAKRGHRILLTYRMITRQMMTTILLGVERQQRTIAAILIPIQQDSGATQRIQTWKRKRAMYHAAVSFMAARLQLACHVWDKQINKTTFG